ncbi:hypothetical protein D3C74_461820 [compost metagenome]
MMAGHKEYYASLPVTVAPRCRVRFAVRFVFKQDGFLCKRIKLKAVRLLIQLKVFNALGNIMLQHFKVQWSVRRMSGKSAADQLGQLIAFGQ